MKLFCVQQEFLYRLLCLPFGVDQVVPETLSQQFSFKQVDISKMLYITISFECWFILCLLMTLR